MNHKLTPEEAKAFADLLNSYLPSETLDYNTKRQIYTEIGDILNLVSTVDEYSEYLNLLQEYLESGLIGLKKTQMQLKSHSSKFKRRYLERIYSKKEDKE